MRYRVRQEKEVQTRSEDLHQPAKEVSHFKWNGKS